MAHGDWWNIKWYTKSGIENLYSNIFIPRKKKVEPTSHYSCELNVILILDFNATWQACFALSGPGFKCSLNMDSPIYCIIIN